MCDDFATVGIGLSTFHIYGNRINILFIKRNIYNRSPTVYIYIYTAIVQWTQLILNFLSFMIGVLSLSTPFYSLSFYLFFCYFYHRKSYYQYFPSIPVLMLYPWAVDTAVIPYGKLIDKYIVRVPTILRNRVYLWMGREDAIFNNNNKLFVYLFTCKWAVARWQLLLCIHINSK
jgi:hypothetical protein